MGKEKISYKSAKTVCAAGKKLLAGRCGSVPNGRGSKYRPIARQAIAENAAVSAAAFPHFRGIYARQRHQIATFCYKNLRERQKKRCSIT